MRRFKYDGKQKVVRCPGGKVLRRSSYNSKHWVYRARAADCRACSLRSRCFSEKGSARTIVVSHGYESLLRARRRRVRWNSREFELYNRHRWRAEGAHGEAKTQHGLGRAARRGLWNVAIQSYLTAAVMNLKRLAATASQPALANSFDVRANRLLAILAACRASRMPGNIILGKKLEVPPLCLRKAQRHSAAA
jgi:hypothetical protein